MAETAIKQRKQLTHVLLKDGRTLVSEATPGEIHDYLANHSHIMIAGEGHAKRDIQNYVPANLDSLESFILDQPDEIQQIIRKKKRWLRSERGQNMTLNYAKNYVQELKAKNL